MAAALHPPQNAEPATLAELLRDLGKDIAVIEDRLAFITNDDELGDALCEIPTLTNRVAGLERSLIGAAQYSSLLMGTGQRNIEQYVASRTNARAATVRKARRLVNWLGEFDLFAAETSVLSQDHLEYLRTKVDNARSHHQLKIDQQIFIDIATTAGWPEFVKVCDYWLIANDPDGEEPNDQNTRRHLSMRRGSGGEFEFSGSCNTVDGQEFETAVLAESERLRQHDNDTGNLRSTTQRHMDAVLNLVKRGAARQNGSHSKPLAAVVISQKLIDWYLNRSAGLIDPNEPIPMDPFDPDGRCELIDGTPIHPCQAMALLAKATVRRIVLDADSRVLDVSYNARSFPEWIKTARTVESRGRCDMPGCDAPHHWLQTDHINPHTNDGPTNWHNSQPACGADNHHKAAKTNQTPWHTKHPHRYRPPQE